jgi:hypothetical protein
MVIRASYPAAQNRSSRSSRTVTMQEMDRQGQPLNNFISHKFIKVVSKLRDELGDNGYHLKRPDNTGRRW